MKNYLIVGGSSGIGLQLVQNLSINNRVFATFCNSQPAEISNVTYSHLNVLDEQLDLTFVPDTIDGIVYCVGAINLKPFARISEADFIADYRKQVGGAIRIIQNILPKLKLSENPSIVLFSTVAVQLGFPFHSMVASSKGAIEGLTKALAAELAPKIRVNCIAPSITDTPLAANLLNTEEKIAANAQRHPLKKIGEPKDLANMAEFLLSENSAWITGQILHVDGGMSTLKL
jgi:NAD(P)-dependent dehydrogenase (short-subunit alcohol dehydrogenase family)